jgi:hypothetical protein
LVDPGVEEIVVFGISADSVAFTSAIALFSKSFNSESTLVLNSKEIYYLISNRSRDVGNNRLIYLQAQEILPFKISYQRLEN